MDAWGEDVAILISKSMHFGRMLPGRGPFSRIRRKRDACGAILASQGPGADATREGDAGGGARWARCGRGEPNGCGQQRGGTQVVGGGAMSAGSGRTAESNAGERRRWRTGAGCGRWLISGCSGTVAARVVVCRGRGNEKETAYAASLRQSDKFRTPVWQARA